MTALRIGTFLAPAMRPVYQAAADALGAELVDGARFDELTDGTLDAAFLCGLPYVELEGVEALVAPALGGGEPVYFSELVAREGERATTLEDFAGRRLAVNEPDSHSGWNVVLATLAQRDVPTGSFDVVETGSHAGSVEAVRSGKADVAAIDSLLYPLLDHDGLTVVERLGPSPSQPLAAAPSLSRSERDRVRRTLSGDWAEVDDATYDPIRAMRAAAVARGGF